MGIIRRKQLGIRKKENKNRKREKIEERKKLQEGMRKWLREGGKAIENKEIKTKENGRGKKVELGKESALTERKCKEEKKEKITQVERMREDNISVQIRKGDEAPILKRTEKLKMRYEESGRKERTVKEKIGWSNCTLEPNGEKEK